MWLKLDNLTVAFKMLISLETFHY